MVLEFVHGYQAHKEWHGWSDLGVKLALRPNWLHSGANAPYLTLHQVGDFLKFAREHGMVQHRFDSLHGYWATQGPNYYLIARLSSRPDLSVDDVISEYASAFGPAAPAIRRWISYCRTTRTTWPSHLPPVVRCPSIATDSTNEPAVNTVCRHIRCWGLGVVCRISITTIYSARLRRF